MFHIMTEMWDFLRYLLLRKGTKIRHQWRTKISAHRTTWHSVHHTANPLRFRLLFCYSPHSWKVPWNLAVLQWTSQSLTGAIPFSAMNWIFLGEVPGAPPVSCIPIPASQSPAFTLKTESFTVLHSHSILGQRNLSLFYFHQENRFCKGLYYYKSIITTTSCSTLHR